MFAQQHWHQLSAYSVGIPRLFSKQLEMPDLAAQSCGSPTPTWGGTSICRNRARLHASVRPDWLNKRSKGVLEPDLPKIKLAVSFS
jgi:hypothetical protein